MRDPDRSKPGLLSRATWLPLGLLFTAALVAVRSTSAAAQLADLGVPSDQLGWALWTQLPTRLLQCGIAACASVALARAWCDLDREEDAPSGLTVGRAIIGWILTTAVFAAVLSGLPSEPQALHASPSLALTANSSASLTLVAAALALVLWGLSLSVRGQVQRRLVEGRGAALAGPLALGLALLIGALPLALLARSWMQAEPTMPVREVVRTLLFEAESLEFQGSAPSLGLLTPGKEQHLDTSDRGSLILPPPGFVRFETPPEGGPYRLVAAVGVDRGVHAELNKRGFPSFVQFRFRILVGGRNVFESTLRAGPTVPTEERVWVRAGGAEGLEVPAGVPIVLTTELLDASGLPLEVPDLPEEIGQVGFADLRLERIEQRPRTRSSYTQNNIIVVVMDTLRRDRCSTYGYSRPTTPHLDAFARDALVFDEAYSTSSWTWPATASLLTGLSPEAHGVVSIESCTLPFELTTLAEALQSEGFTTAAFSGNPLVAPLRGFDQGFESFDYHQSEFRMTEELFPGIRRFVETNHASRFFLYLHLVDPHTPHLPRAEELARLGGEMPAGFPDPPEGRGMGMDLYAGNLLRDARFTVPPEHAQWISDVYDASVATGDHYFGELMALLDEYGLGESTVVAFTSDHGEELLDHGRLGHGHDLWEELVHVPLILGGPHIPRGDRTAAPVSNRHLAPTLARLAGASFDGDTNPLNLLDRDAWSADDARPVFFSTHKQRVRAVPEALKLYGIRTGAEVLHWSPEERHTTLRYFDLLSDPAQQFDLSDKGGLRVEQLQELLAEHLAAELSSAPKNRLGAGAATQELLINMGYMDRHEQPNPKDKQ